MLNYIWSGMLLIGLLVGFLNGRLEQITKAILDSSRNAIDVSIALLGILCLWTGIMEIASRAGLVKAIANVIRPVTNILFPSVPKDHPALAAMVMNIVANCLGLGNAATPLGLKAMDELQKLNKDKDIATDDMCMFLVVNTASLQLIPATLIALRLAAGSKNPTEIIGAIWITSSCCFISGVISAKLFAAAWKKKTLINKGGISK